MSVLRQLEQENGTTMTTLGKFLAQEVVAGNTYILQEAVDLLLYKKKDVRVGAARIIQQVAIAYPQRVAPYLPHILPALDLPELQIRWMMIHTLGLCAAYETRTALKALPKAQKFIQAQSGATLWNATIVYLGSVGETSSESAKRVLPILEQALDEIPHLTKAILESYLRLLDVADQTTLLHLSQDVARFMHSKQPGVRAVVDKIMKRVALSGLLLPEPVSGLELCHAALIHAYPEQVYDAFTTSDNLNCWFAIDATVDKHVDGIIQFRRANLLPDSRVVQDSGRILVMSRPKQFAFQRHPARNDQATNVVVDFQPVSEGTVVHIRESGFRDTPSGQAALAKSSADWGEALVLLKVYLEHGISVWRSH